MVFKRLVNLKPSFEFNKQIGTEIPSGLVPIGDTGLFTNIGQPVDPTDCEKYPDSLFCGNPLSRDFISLSPQIIANECNVGIQLEGTLGFIKMPPVHLVYRFPQCRELPEFLPKDENYETPVQIPANNWEFLNGTSAVLLTFTINRSEQYIDRGIHGNDPPVKVTESYTVKVNVKQFNIPLQSTETVERIIVTTNTPQGAAVDVEVIGYCEFETEDTATVTRNGTKTSNTNTTKYLWKVTQIDNSFASDFPFFTGFSQGGEKVYLWVNDYSRAKQYIAKLKNRSQVSYYSEPVFDGEVVVGYDPKIIFDNITYKVYVRGCF